MFVIDTSLAWRGRRLLPIDRLGMKVWMECLEQLQIPPLAGMTISFLGQISSVGRNGELSLQQLDHAGEGARDYTDYDYTGCVHTGSASQGSR